MSIKPGIYPDLAEDVYRSGDGWRDCMSASTLWHGNTSMLQLKAAIDGTLGDTDSDAKKFGRDYHCRLLTPRLFFEQYAVMPEFDPTDGKPKTSGWKNTNDYRGQRDEWLAHHEGVQIVAQEDMDTINAMAKGLFNHPVVKMLRSEGGHEVSVRWDAKGVLFRSRLDKYIPGSGDMPPTILDLKKTRSLDNHDLDRDCLKYGYHMRGYAYVQAVKEVTGKDADFIWIFQQDKPPYDVRVRQFDQSSFEIGRFEFNSLIDRYKFCLDRNDWPGVSSDIEQRCLPEWYIKQNERMATPI